MILGNQTPRRVFLEASASQAWPTDGTAVLRLQLGDEVAGSADTFPETWGSALACCISSGFEAADQHTTGEKIFGVVLPRKEAKKK